ncbi:MAG: helix-turn-helix domain-containing protein [Saprospiraceae bacterium]
MRVVYTVEEQNTLKQLGNRIRDLRIEIDLSQEKLAFACDLDRTYIGSVERGERNISILNIVKISNALGVNPQELLLGL